MAPEPQVESSHRTARPRRLSDAGGVVDKDCGLHDCGPFEPPVEGNVTVTGEITAVPCLKVDDR